MNDKQFGAMLSIASQVTGQWAALFDAPQTATATSLAPAGAAKIDRPLWVEKRGRYLMEYVEAGGELSRSSVSVATKKAGMGNAGSVTSHGYVENTGKGSRVITDKGREWLKQWSFTD